VEQWDYQASPFYQMLNPEQLEELFAKIQEEQASS